MVRNYDKQNEVLEASELSDVWIELVNKNSHIPKKVFEILSQKGYELFEGEIKSSDKEKPILLYIPNENAYYTIKETLRRNHELIFMLLGGYTLLSGNIIRGELTSIAYIRDQKTGYISTKKRKFNPNDDFNIKMKGTGALLIREK